MFFGNYGLRNTWFDKCLKSNVTKDSLRGNMGNEPKH